MFKELRSTVVVTANTFNPSIVSQLWLVNKGIVEGDGFLDGCIFTGELSQTVAREFNLLVIAPQLQFTPKVPENRWADQANESLRSFVTSLPETPYSAIGLNFTAIVAPSSNSSIELERSFFFSDALPFANEFREGNCRYGGYFSKDMFGGRLKLSIKPHVAQTDFGTEDRFFFGFNFHRDVPEENRVDVIIEHLSRMNECLETVNRIVASIES